jgi:hypothetical protein
MNAINHTSSFDSDLNRQTTWFIVATQILQLGGTALSAGLQLGWKSAAAISFSLGALYVLYAVISRNRVLRHLVVFSFIAGLLELFADHYSVAGNETLVYPAEPMLWTSPLYMPFAWIAVFSQLGYYSLLIVRWKGLTTAIIVLGVLGGLYIPIYEHLAADAGWWYYRNTPMLFNAPYYVILAEAMLSVSIPPLMLFSLKGSYGRTAFAALIQGIVIFLSCYLAYHLITAF